MIPVDLLNYQLIRLLGRGGMGEVYLARNKNIDQFVAVKAMHAQYASNPLIRARFKQEAVMLNSLNHPNIVKFLNFVENEYGVFLIMEYVEGDTLEEYINEKNGLIVEEKAYPMFVEILDAFSYAHQHGIIHRDIKPGNIFLDREGHIRVMDFGIAQIVSDANQEKGAKVAMGTPAYMSPEQVYGQTLDQRSDIYSLGVLFHQMLTGRAPYDSTTMSDLEIKSHVINERLPRLKNYYPYISDELQKIIDKATAKRPEDRYASCEDMKKALKKIFAPERKSRLSLYISAAAIAACLLIGLGCWDFFRTKVSYYKDYAEFYGVPKGIGSLSRREVSHRSQSYRVESSRWKVRRVTLVNAKLKPIGHTDTEHINSRFTDVYYFYSDNGHLDYKKAYDAYGKLLYKIDYDENLRVAMFKHDDERGTAKRLQSNTTQLFEVNENDRSSITRYLLTFDEKGLLQKIEYATGEDNTPVGDSDNIYGQAYTYDDKGRITEVNFLGQDGKTRGSKFGLAIKQFGYDKDDNWVTITYLSADKKPSHDGNNCPLVKIDYDKWGNRVGERYYTIDEKPSYRTDIAACGVTYEYDNEGNIKLQTLIDGEGKAITGRQGYATAQMEYDENGFVTKLEYLDREGKRTNVLDDGEIYSSVVNSVDEKGLNLSTSMFDTMDRPINNSHGIHRVECKYDSIGEVTEVTYFDKNLKPAAFDGCHSSHKLTYNDLGFQTSVAYFDKEGKPAYSQDGVALILLSYDKIGNITKIEYVDTDGKTLINSRERYAVQELTYDPIGNIKTVCFFNKFNKPCMITAGYHRREYVYDENTNFTTEIKYFNANGAVIRTEKFTYDANGNPTALWVLNGAGALMGIVNHNEYDGNNRVTTSYATNLSGRKVNLPGMNYAEMRSKYDERGNVIECSYWDASGSPAVDEQKRHKRIKGYDERNNNIYEKNLGKDNKPIRGSSVNPEAKVTYDDMGHITSISCLDGYGKPYTGAAGFHRMEMEWNDNLLVREIYKDTNGNLAINTLKGCAKVTYAYDARRNCISEKYFGRNGNLTNYVTYAYNERGQQTEMCLHSSSGKLDDSKYGFSKLVITYNADGTTPVKKTFFRGGRAIAYQSYNTQTGTWGSITFQ